MVYSCAYSGVHTPSVGGSVALAISAAGAEIVRAHLEGCPSRGTDIELPNLSVSVQAAGVLSLKATCVQKQQQQQEQPSTIAVAAAAAQLNCNPNTVRTMCSGIPVCA